MGTSHQMLRVVMLGSGTSHGVPMIGCGCRVCTSDDPRDKRSRPALVVQWGQRCILIDTPPELRLQCLANGITRVDAILYTHHHADHIVGLDDVRRFNALQKSAITCYGTHETLDRVAGMFPYAFVDDPDYPSAKPDLRLSAIDGAFEVFGLPVTPIRLLHGQLPVLGFRFGPFAYCTDVSTIPDESWALLEGLDVLILDALRLRPHATHMNLEQAVEAARRIGARQTYFTHIAHELLHAEVDAELPDGMALGFDGLSFDVAMDEKAAQ